MKYLNFKIKFLYKIQFYYVVELTHKIVTHEEKQIHTGKTTSILLTFTMLSNKVSQC